MFCLCRIGCTSQSSMCRITTLYALSVCHTSVFARITRIDCLTVSSLSVVTFINHLRISKELDDVNNEKARCFSHRFFVCLWRLPTGVAEL